MGKDVGWGTDNLAGEETWPRGWGKERAVFSAPLSTVCRSLLALDGGVLISQHPILQGTATWEVQDRFPALPLAPALSLGKSLSYSGTLAATTSGVSNVSGGSCCSHIPLPLERGLGLLPHLRGQESWHLVTTWCPAPPPPCTQQGRGGTCKHPVTPR